MKILKYLFAFCLLLSQYIYAQNSYATKLISPSNELVSYAPPSFNKVDKFGIINYSGAERSFDLISLNTDGSIYQTNSIHFLEGEEPSSNLSYFNFYHYIYHHQYHIISQQSTPIPEHRGVIVFNENTQEHTAFFTDNNPSYRHQPTSSISEQNLIAINRRLWPLAQTEQSAGLGILLYNPISDSQIWNKRYYSNYNLRSYPIAITESPMATFSILAQDSLGYDNAFYRSHLLVLDTIGNLQHSAYIENDVFFRKSQMDSQGNLYIAGTRKTEESPISPFFDVFGLVVSKLSPELELLWTKSVDIEAFSIRSFVQYDLKISTSDNIVLGISTEGDFPAIVAQISPEGQLLDYKGYNIPSPFVAVAPDESLFLLGIDMFDFQIGNAPIAKTNPDGTIDGCSNYPACLSLSDYPLEVEYDASWQTEDIPPLERYMMAIDTVSYMIEENCIDDSYPDALFSISDTICQYDCISPMALNNQQAQKVIWHIQGPALDSIIEDKTFEFCFDSSGLYTINHEIWVLGCMQTHLDSIQVLSDDFISPLADSVQICHLPYTINVQAHRPLHSIVWNTGETTTSIQASEIGSYSFSASDGYCFAEEALVLSGVDGINAADALGAISDTTLCPDLLPYVLRPKSVYTDSFSINGAPFYESIILNQADSYTISAEIEGCIYEQLFELKIEDCPSPIFIPNVFSPNNDGVNDEVYAQGLDFTPQSIEVYDRWGGLIYQSTQVPFSWDGKEANNGTYIFVLKYFNHRNQQYESVTQDVVLLR